MKDVLPCGDLDDPEEMEGQVLDALAGRDVDLDWIRIETDLDGDATCVYVNLTLRNESYRVVLDLQEMETTWE